MGVAPELIAGLKYRCIGPTRGGRVVAVAADPDRQSVFYFGAVAGGIWRSDDAGLFWENISDGQLSASSIGALAVAPSDGNVIYAGTGEATIRIDVSHGDGVYRSTDAGKTWNHLGLPESRHIGAIAVHPNDPDTAWVAALGHSAKDNPERGLYRTTDGGATWDLVLHVSSGAGAVDVAVDPNNPRIVFATIWQARRNFWSMNSGGPDCGLWRSDDGGDTWQDISRNPGLPDGTLGKMGVTVSEARRGRVWAIVEAEGRKRGLFRSDDHGDTWEKVSSQPDLCWRPWYYQHVFAHPTEPDTVFVMNRLAWKSIDGGKTFAEMPTPHGDNHALWIDPNNPDRMIGADDGGAWVSLNGGDSWSSIYNQLTAQFYHVAVDDQYPYLVYGTQQDNSSIAVPSRTGRGAINWADCYPPGTAESGYIAPKPGNPDIVFVGAIGSSPGGGEALQRYDRKSGQVRLVSIWPESYHDGATAEYRFQWTYPIVFSPQDPDTLYVCGNHVFRSRDEGQSWDVISPDLTYADPDTLGVSGPLTMDTAGAEMYATIFSFVASAHRPGTLMAGSDDGRVHRSDNDGGDWTEVTPDGLEKFSQVTMLAESPHHEGTVYMTVARHKEGDYAPYVYKTADFGDTWTRIDAGLPDGEFCRVVREDPNRPGTLYVGTELGLWVSFDDGAAWQSLQSNLPVSPVYDLVVKDTDLVVATHGRSFWILDDLTQLHQIADSADLADTDSHLFAPRETVRVAPDLFAGFWGRPVGKNYHVSIGQNATYYFDEHETGHTSTRVLDAGTDIAPGAAINYWLKSAPTDPITLTIVDGDGAEIDRFTSDIPDKKEDRSGLYLTADAGMNCFRWPMRYPDGPKMTGSDFHPAAKGPLAAPGGYQVRLEAGDEVHQVPLELISDPRVDCSPDDFAEQLGFLRKIQAKLVEVTDAVNEIRQIKDQLAGWKSRQGDDEVLGEAVDSLTAELEAVETALVQPEFTGSGDTLNYREQLFEKLTNLVPVVASADARPTSQSYAVYDKLAGQIDEQLGIYSAISDGSLAAMNTRLAGLDIGIVGA